jgi:hypothetical protein
VLLTDGATVTAANLDGAPVPLATGRELGHPVIRTTVDLRPGQARVLRLRLHEPARPGTPTLLLQPVVNAGRSVVSWAGCVGSSGGGAQETKG